MGQCWQGGQCMDESFHSKGTVPLRSWGIAKGPTATLGQVSLLGDQATWHPRFTMTREFTTNISFLVGGSAPDLQQGAE